MLSRPWCWVIFPTAAKAEQFREELAGTLGIEPDVPFVLLTPPVPLAGGKAGWACHYWAGVYGPELDEAIRDQVETLATHPRYDGVMTIGTTPPLDWVPQEDA